jgi:hypothetical protein
LILIVGFWCVGETETDRDKEHWLCSSFVASASSTECGDHMEITVAVKVDHLPTAYNAPIRTPASDKLRTILVPKVNHKGTVQAILNDCSCCFHQIERGHWRTSTTDMLAR